MNVGSTKFPAGRNPVLARGRFSVASPRKAHGETYTPPALARFVALQIVRVMQLPAGRPVRILDPAVGHGELLIQLLEQIHETIETDIEVRGFETDPSALEIASERLGDRYPNVSIHIEPRDFLSFVLSGFNRNTRLFATTTPTPYDLVIANPPYVRTQVMGAAQARRLADLFDLSGRIDLYHAFVLGLTHLLANEGVAGIILSNRFMTTKAGANVRKALLERLNVIHTWDLGDTKLFGAAVLPAVLLARRAPPDGVACQFTSIYQTTKPATHRATDAIAALTDEGVVALDDGRHFEVSHGKLSTGGSRNGVWRMATPAIDRWLASVESHRWKRFGEVGKIRVGVKTCADKVFIRDDWDSISGGVPELLRPVSTHHVGRRYRPLQMPDGRRILYPHEVVQGRRRAVDLRRYPMSRAYLEQHRQALERRRYVLEAGRAWYELWVPQNPDAWARPKLVFRDIAEQPAFWIDRDGSVVNGDCYWFMGNEQGSNGLRDDDLLSLTAAVGNSTFIERFYDYRFNNKLYAGRRRYATQYVEHFPLPDPNGVIGRAIIQKAQAIEADVGSAAARTTEKEVDAMVWEAFKVAP